MSKRYKDHFTNTIGGYSADLRTADPQELKARDTHIITLEDQLMAFGTDLEKAAVIKSRKAKEVLENPSPDSYRGRFKPRGNWKGSQRYDR